MAKFQTIDPSPPFVLPPDDGKALFCVHRIGRPVACGSGGTLRRAGTHAGRRAEDWGKIVFVAVFPEHYIPPSAAAGNTQAACKGIPA